MKEQSKRFSYLKEGSSTKSESGGESYKQGGKIPLSRNEKILAIVVILLLIALGVVGYLFIREKQQVESSTELSSEEAKKIKEDVGKLMLLPEDEEPTIATIIDVEKLRGENSEFYKNASNGDKLLIYSQKVIIYSPDKNLIINVAPIIRQPSDEGVESDTEEVAEPLTIEIRNGSETTGAEDDYESTIISLGSDYQILVKGNAANDDYTGITVYDLTGIEKNELVDTLIEELGATVSTLLPTEEATTEADVVVIVGN
jgi:hypothetical protein